jgi:osmotically-inducible protein OsmY
MNIRHNRPLLGVAVLALSSTLLLGCGKAPEAAPAPTAPPPGAVATAIDDTAITGLVKAALLGDPDIKSFDISVNTVQGVVQLTGDVGSQGQIERATRLATAVEGARSVKNELTVKP